MSASRCCIAACERLRSQGGAPKVTLHKFPNPVKDKERFTTWVLRIGGDIIELDNHYIFLNRRVCHIHFEEKYVFGSKRLLNIAVPTLNMPDPRTVPIFSMTERRPLRQIENIIDPTPALDVTAMLFVDPVRPNGYFEAEVDVESRAGFTPLHMSSQEGHLDCEEMLLERGADVNPKAHNGYNGDSPSQVTGPIATSTSHQPLTRRHIGKPQVTSIQQRKTKSAKQSVVSKQDKKMYQQLLAFRVKISKAKKTKQIMAAKIKTLQEIRTNPVLLERLEKLPSAGKILTALQLRETLKKGKGRRFSESEKIIALSIYKQSPKAYRYLRRIFILPAPQILIKLIQRANIKPGINKSVFEQLKAKSERMKIEERLVVLLFDEMSLKPNLSYDEKGDQVIGVTNENKFINHAQVFMIKGLIKNFKQPVYYSFANAATKGIVLAQEIKTVIKELQKANFIVVATISDQGTNNRHAINILINETKAQMLREGKESRENVILINNQKIYPLFDPPHLLKGIRNNLLTKNLKYFFNNETKIAKWDHLQTLLKENPGYKGIRMIPKLTEAHVDPAKINKMKVKYAAQVFSRTVSASMGYLADKGILPSDSRDTADLLLLIDKLFDSVNGSFGKMKEKYSKPLLGPVRPQSIHHQFWNEILKILKSMQFINASGANESVPSIKNWVWTINGIKDLVKHLQEKYSVKSVWLRHLNQDPLENFFGSIRSHGCRNTNPTPSQFQAAYATLLINNIASVHTPGANCENDLSTALQPYIIQDCHEGSSGASDFMIDDILGLDLVDLDDKKKNLLIMAPLEYVSGYFIRQAKRKITKKCKKCLASLTDEEEKSEYIKSREYENKSWLCYPKEALVKVISEIQDITYYMAKKNINSKLLIDSVKTIAYVVCDLNFIQCDTHRDALISFLISSVSRFFIFHYCKNINRVLSGRKDVDDPSNDLEMAAKKYFSKCLKRKK